jgi:hypothetical protein
MSSDALVDGDRLDAFELYRLALYAQANMHTHVGHLAYVKSGDLIKSPDPISSPLIEAEKWKMVGSHL